MQHMGSQNRCFNAAFRPPTAFKLLFPDVNFGFPSLLIISFYSCSQSVRGVTLSLSLLWHLLFHCRQKLGILKVLKEVRLPASSEFKGNWVPNEDLEKASTQRHKFGVALTNLVKSNLADTGLS